VGSEERNPAGWSEILEHIARSPTERNSIRLRTWPQLHATAKLKLRAEHSVRSGIPMEGSRLWGDSTLGPVEWLGSATGLDLLSCLSRERVGRTRIGAVEAVEDFVRGVLQPCIRLVEHAGCLARQLAQLVAVGHMRECPENQIRTHYEFLLEEFTAGRKNRSPSKQVGSQRSARLPTLSSFLD